MRFDCIYTTMSQTLRFRVSGPGGQAQDADDPEAVAKAVGDTALSDEDKVFIEGSVKRASHLRRERNAALVAECKADFLAKHGHFHCEECENDWREEYGPEIAAACFEAHHANTQVADMEDGHGSVKTDLKLLCANCHRAEHRKMKLAS